MGTGQNCTSDSFARRDSFYESNSKKTFFLLKKYLKGKLKKEKSYRSRVKVKGNNDNIKTTNKNINLTYAFCFGVS